MQQRRLTWCVGRWNSNAGPPSYLEKDNTDKIRTEQVSGLLRTSRQATVATLLADTGSLVPLDHIVADHSPVVVHRRKDLQHSTKSEAHVCTGRCDRQAKEYARFCAK